MDVKERGERYLAGTYRRNPVTLDHGKGSLVWDEDGREYIDFGSGIAVNGLGIANDAWLAAVTEQLGRLPHASNLYHTAPAARLAEKLCTRTGMKKVFLCNSGAEANECAIKCARKASFDRYGAGRGTVVTLSMSFHGRTLATLSATGQPALHRGFDPMPAGFVTAEPEAEAVRAACDETTCAVMLELVQGEGGVRALDPGFVRDLRAFTEERDLLLIVDEVQTGNGRTGTLYAYEQYGILPDIVTTAKGLGNGLPIGAALFGAGAAEVLDAGSHGSTFGGNPAACAGACAVLDQITPELLAGVKRRSERIRVKLSACPGVKEVTGLGLMVGIRTEKEAAQVVRECLDRGLLVLTAKDRVRLLPALNIPDDVLDRGLQILCEVLS